MGASSLSALVLFAAISFLVGPHETANRATAASAAAEAAPGDASTSDGRSPLPVVAHADELAKLTGEGASTIVPAEPGSDAGQQEPEVVARQPEVDGEAGAAIAAPPPALRTFYVQYRDGAGALATQQVQAFDDAGARKVLRDFRGDPEILKGPATEVSW